jgi:hypothetical protein
MNNKKFNNLFFSSIFVKLVKQREMNWNEHLTWIGFKNSLAWNMQRDLNWLRVEPDCEICEHKMTFHLLKLCHILIY